MTTGALEWFLAGAGFVGAQRIPLAGDASARRYERLIRSDGTHAMLAVTPDPAADLIPFMAVGGILAAHGFSVPTVLAADPAAGFCVQEDFGNDTFSRCLERGDDPAALYALAADALIALHRRLPGASAELADLDRFDADYFVGQAELFVDVHLASVLGMEPDGDLRASFARAWREVLEPVCGGPVSLILRDFHVDNVMRLPRPGIAAAGLIDFQNAGVGPVAYDLVSLLEDARRDVPDEIVDATIERYLEAFPGLDAEAFHRSYAVLGGVRHLRIVAIFERQALAMGRRGYLAHLPRVWRLLETKLGDPALAPVARWLNRYVPEERRKGFLVSETDL